LGFFRLFFLCFSSQILNPDNVYYTELPEAEPDNLLFTEWNAYCREVGRLLAEGQEGRHMTPEVICCFEDQDVAEAARLMLEKQISQLPVLTRDKRLVGIVSLGDLAASGRQSVER
jgi:CBS domain-containing protein